MIFDDEIVAYQSRNNSAGQANTIAFLRRWNIDQVVLETFVRRSVRGNGQLYYVSTVPRGLGGSTSDIDFMVIAPDQGERDSNLTSMLFNQGRRVGIKTLTRAEVRAGLQAVEAWLAAWEAGDYCQDALPIKWINLERAVNGVTFDGEPEFLDHLPLLARWACVVAFVEFNQNLLLTSLACRADRLGAARAYGEAAVMSAMDGLMGACGRVQWNTKWIYERWRSFVAEAREPRVQLGVRRIERLRAVVEAQVLSGQAIQDALGDVRRYLLDGDPSRLDGDRARLAAANGVAVNDFLPGAVALQGGEGAVVVDKSIFEDLMEPSAAAFDTRAANVGLELAQKGFLRVDFKRSDRV